MKATFISDVNELEYSWTTIKESTYIDKLQHGLSFDDLNGNIFELQAVGQHWYLKRVILQEGIGRTVVDTCPIFVTNMTEVVKATKQNKPKKRDVKLIKSFIEFEVHGITELLKKSTTEAFLAELRGELNAYNRVLAEMERPID